MGTITLALVVVVSLRFHTLEGVAEMLPPPSLGRIVMKIGDTVKWQGMAGEVIELNSDNFGYRATVKFKDGKKVDFYSRNFKGGPFLDELTTAEDAWFNLLENHGFNNKMVGLSVLKPLVRELVREHGWPEGWATTHKKRSMWRVALCRTAMEYGVDLAEFKYRGRLVMTRGLLDVWNKVYQEKYGSAAGTAGQKEAVRRDVKTRLAKELKDG